VSAFQALEVVEDVLIQEVAERGSRCAAGNCANYAADDRSGNAASDYSTWAGEGTRNGADTSAGGSSRECACCPGNGSD
jgi:hypothetical protein